MVLRSRQGADRRDCGALPGVPKKKWRETLGKTGDPRANNGPHSLMKRIEQSLAAAVAQAGFGTPTKTRLATPGSLALDYRKGQSILTCWFDKHTATLSAEMLIDDQVISIVRVPLDAPRDQAQLLEKLQEFTSIVSKCLMDFTETTDRGPQEKVQ